MNSGVPKILLESVSLQDVSRISCSVGLTRSLISITVSDGRSFGGHVSPALKPSWSKLARSPSSPSNGGANCSRKAAIGQKSVVIAASEIGGHSSAGGAGGDAILA